MRRVSALQDALILASGRRTQLSPAYINAHELRGGCAESTRSKFRLLRASSSPCSTRIDSLLSQLYDPPCLSSGVLEACSWIPGQRHPAQLAIYPRHDDP